MNGFPHAVLAEWTKFRTIRSTWWTLALMSLGTIGIAVLVGATESIQDDDTVTGGSLGGAATWQIAAAVLGVLVMAGEFSARTIRPTVAASRSRTVVVVAKATVVAGVSFVAGLAASLTSCVIGSIMLGDDYASGDVFAAVLGVAACFAAAGVLGVAVGAIAPHTVGAIMAVILGILLPTMLAPLTGDGERWVAGASPAAAMQKLAQSSDATADSVGTLGAWPSLLLVTAYAAALLAVGAACLNRRDV